MGQQIANTVGMGLGALSTIQAIRSGQYQNQAIQRAQALANPEVRAGLVNSPFTAGTMFLGGGQRALPTTQIPDQGQGTGTTPYYLARPGQPSQAGPQTLSAPAQPGQVSVPQQFAWQPNLPPMAPDQQLKQIQAQQGIDLSQYDPTTSRVANDAGNPEDVGNIIRRSGPQGISNVTARTGGLGMFQLSPSQYTDLGNGQYGLVDAQGNVRRVGAYPGAAATVTNTLKEQNTTKTKQGLAEKGYGAMAPSGTESPPPAAPPAAAPAPATPGATPTPRLVPLDLNDPTPIGQKLAPKPQAPQAPQPQAQPPQQPQTPPQGQQNPIGYPSPAFTDQYTPTVTQPVYNPAQPPQLMPVGSPSQSFVDANLPTPPPVTPPVISNRSPEARQLHGPQGLNKESPMGNSLVGENVTADGLTLKYGLPKLDATQRMAGIMFGDSDLTKLAPSERAQVESVVNAVAQGSKELQGLVTGLTGEESSRVASILMTGDAFLKLHNMGKGVLDYVGPMASTGGVRRGIANLHNYGLGTGDPGRDQAQGLINQMRLLAFTFGGKQLSTRGGNEGSTFGLINFSDAGDTEAKRVDSIIPQLQGISKSQFVSRGALFADALKTQIESVLGSASYGMKPQTRDHLVAMYNALDQAVSPIPKP